MTLIRFKFSKGVEVRFISHLDLQRAFQRTFRRAEIDMKYSQGFNPHPKLSFAMAMPVGMTSDGEYGDLEISSKIPLELILSKVNSQLPKGLKVTEVKITDEPQKSLTSIVRYSDYHVKVPIQKDITIEKISSIMEILFKNEEILIQKKNKRGKLVEKNIRPFINEIKIKSITSNHISFLMKLATGSNGNLKPMTILECINNIEEVFLLSHLVEIHRIEMYNEDGRSLMQVIS